MSLFYTNKLKDKEGKYGLHYKDQVILTYTEEDTQAIEDLAQQLNWIYAEQEISIKASTKLIEYYQELILKTLTDKLSEIDNMYAMKKMLTETSQELERLINRISTMNKAGMFDKKETTKGEE